MLRSHGVFHGDGECRNKLWDDLGGHLFVIDHSSVDVYVYAFKPLHMPVMSMGRGVQHQPIQLVSCRANGVQEFANGLLVKATLLTHRVHCDTVRIKATTAEKQHRLQALSL